MGGGLGQRGSKGFLVVFFIKPPGQLVGVFVAGAFCRFQQRRFHRAARQGLIHPVEQRGVVAPLLAAWGKGQNIVGPPLFFLDLLGERAGGKGE